MRTVISRVMNDLLDRYDGFRDRLASGRFPRANERIAVVLLIAALLGLGCLTALAMTRPDGVTAYLPHLDGDPASASSVVTTEPTEIVTPTVKRNSTTARGNVVVRTVAGRRTTVPASDTLPEATAREALTVTTREIATVTDVQPVTVTGPPVTVTAPPVTVTVVETVTCAPPDCHP
jgi:hypothetical protein